MSCRNNPKGLKKILWTLLVLQTRWRMIYGPRFKSGKIKEAWEVHKQRKRIRKNKDNDKI